MSQIKTIKQVLQGAYTKIPANEAEILLAFVIKQNQEWLISHQEQTITANEVENFDRLIQQRSQGTPVAYLTGVKEFYGRPFKVPPNVLIPRPDSELIIDEAKAFLNKDLQATSYQLPAILDVGTGSGCLIITLALETNNKFNYTGLDISDKALTIAKQNALALGANVNFIQSNLLSTLPTPDRYPATIINSAEGGIPPERDKLPATSYQLIIANLPYLTSNQLTEPTIQQEPTLALDGGKDGLHYIKQLLEQIPQYTKKGSLILIEIDPAQKDKIVDLLQAIPPQLFNSNEGGTPPKAVASYKLPANLIKDLSGQDRLLRLERI